MRNFKRALIGLVAGASLMASGCLGGTFAPQGATRTAIYTGLLGGVVDESATTLVNLVPVAEAAAILWNQPIQNYYCLFTGCPDTGIGDNNTGF